VQRLTRNPLNFTGDFFTLTICPVKDVNVDSDPHRILQTRRQHTKREENEKKTRRKRRKLKLCMAHSLLYQRLLLDDLVLEFEGQHVHYVDVAVISGKQQLQ